MKMLRKKIRSEKGATYVEYVIATVILVGVFVAASTALETAGQSRSQKSSQTVEGMVPCIEGSSLLSGDQCK